MSACVDTEALSGGFDTPPVAAAHAFRAAMSALARPGRIETISGGRAPAPVSVAAATLLLTLCDAETPLHLAGAHDNRAMRDWVAFHLGAPLVAPGDAMFALGTWEALGGLDRYAQGTPDYPDRSATLIVELSDLVASGSRLRGPGIRDAAALNLPDPVALQRNAAQFPLGLDFYFTCDSRIAALPRSTRIG
ncbi:phosphonate C-P lyase system protein PhnH [Pseudooceanicola sp.]|uniref:phosphonate C-P lyase system protein PhnH n=1 Tax=Pseudooceanicola sp. TaxID=1914328 RepID=UPI002607310C|nr:phosphonate C-P lyase system protein PhnH [Pseudooceanicola sp.]MDF1855543.1 phosphonate C-P lyase system protein PhnH [Pseudooceanicola sp.]